MADSDIAAVGSAYNPSMSTQESEAERDARGRRVLWIFIALAIAAGGLGAAGYFYARSTIATPAATGSVRG